MCIFSSFVICLSSVSLLVLTLSLSLSCHHHPLSNHLQKKKIRLEEAPWSNFFDMFRASFDTADGVSCDFDEADRDGTLSCFVHLSFSDSFTISAEFSLEVFEEDGRVEELNHLLSRLLASDNTREQLSTYKSTLCY